MARRIRSDRCPWSSAGSPQAGAPRPARTSCALQQNPHHISRSGRAPFRQDLRTPAIGGQSKHASFSVHFPAENRKSAFYPHVCSECRLGAMPDPAPHRGEPGTKEFNKMTKKYTGDKPRPLPGAEPARWAELQQIFQPPWELPWTGDWVQVRPWGQKLASFQTNFGVQVHGWCHRPKRHFIFGPQA